MINVKEQFGRWFPKSDDNSHFEASVILKEIEEVTPPEEKQAKVIAMFKGNKPTDCMTVLQTEHDKYTELMMQISPAKKSLDIFTDEERAMYASLYGEDKLDLMYSFPGDIFMNDTIPVEDIMLIKCYNSPNKIINFARIKILPEAERKSNIQKMLDGETEYAEVGWFKLTFKDIHDITFYMSIGVMECAGGIDLCPGKHGWIEGENNGRMGNINPISYIEEINATVKDLSLTMGYWYTLEYSLLSPLIKECGISSRKIENPIQKNKKNKVTNHTICFAKIKREIAINPDPDSDEAKGHTMKKPIWYVTGHYREYKSGKRIFIKGYYKGPERNKNKLEESRTREIPEDLFLTDEEIKHVYDVKAFMKLINGETL